MTNPEFKTGDRIVVINDELFFGIPCGTVGEVEYKDSYIYGQKFVKIKFSNQSEQIVPKQLAHLYIKHQSSLEAYLEREWANYDKVIAQELRKFDVVIAEYQVRRVIGNVQQFYDRIASMTVINSLFKDFGPSNINSLYGKMLTDYLPADLPDYLRQWETLRINHDRT